MQRIVFLSLAGLLVAGVTLGEDFWVKKEYMQWTDEEVRRVMTNSPWAKDVTVTAPQSALGGRRAAVATDGDATETGGGGRRGGRGGGGGGAAGGGEVLLTLNVSWRSAQPLRKAIVKSRLGAATTVPPEAQQLIAKEQDDYVIVVSGIPAQMARAINNPAVLGKSTLRAGKKPPIEPRSVDFQTRTQSVDVIFMFPRTSPIIADDKEVEIILKLDTVEAKKKFNLKDMVLNGKLEL